MPKLHDCPRTHTRGYEKEDFTLWWFNGETDIQVNFCPHCGFKAAIKVGEKPHVHVKVTPSSLGAETLKLIKAGTLTQESADAYRRVIDKEWEEEVLNNPHIKHLHGTFLDPSRTDDRAKLLLAVSISGKEQTEKEPATEPTEGA